EDAGLTEGGFVIDAGHAGDGDRMVVEERLTVGNGTTRRLDATDGVFDIRPAVKDREGDRSEWRTGHAVAEVGVGADIERFGEDRRRTALGACIREATRLRVKDLGAGESSRELDDRITLGGG